MDAECLDYRQLPGQNPLFLKFLYRFDEVCRWYARVHLDPADLRERARFVLARPDDYPRRRLAELLLELNRRMGTGPLTLANIDKLARPGSLAVVTGQQVGLFGGPALAVYKAMTAIRLAQLLEEWGFPAVPVFWLAADDSDFEEVRHTCFLTAQGELTRIVYPASARENTRMAGAVRLEAVAESIARVAEVGGEFAGDALNLLRRAYLPERTFGEALGAWLTLLFGDYGLVLFSALAPGYKELLQSSLEVAVRERARIVEELLERGESLRQAGLAPQVAVDGQETLLFRIDGEHRFKLGFDGERYLPKRRREIGRDLEETLRWVQDDPSAFGPNVLLRPILQDCLLPTAVYVGGPAEIAYFAQSSSIAPFWGKQLAVFPRIGITLVDRKAQRRLKKHRLNVSEVIGAPFDGLLHRLVREEDAASVLDELDQWDQEVATRVRGLRSRLTPIAPGLDAMLSRTELKVNYHLNRVRNRFVDDFSQRRSHLRRHLDYLYTNLFPEQTLQERVINFNYFLMQEGPALVGRLLRTTDPFLKGHHVVYV